MIYLLLCVSLVYLLITSIIFYMNWHDFTPLIDKKADSTQSGPLVSICIPARNEAQTIARAMRSALNQSYVPLEIVVLDDQSTDNTSEILSKFEKKYGGGIKVLAGEKKPDNWLGKSWACHQLSKQARGDILFFIDADVWLGPQAVARAISSLRFHKVNFLTVWPVQKMETFWEKTVIPLVYYGLLTLLPTRFVHEKPGIIPNFIAEWIDPKLAAACGQCMVFRRAAYDQIGGHQSVKTKMVEDVALARKIKQAGLCMRMFHGKNTLWCRMYTSAGEIWQGFRKNFLALYGNSITVFTLMILLNFVVFVGPVIALIVSFINTNVFSLLLSFLALIVIIIQRLMLAKWYHWSPWYTFLQPLGVLWFTALGVQVVYDHLFGKRAIWKDRPTS